MQVVRHGERVVTERTSAIAGLAHVAQHEAVHDGRTLGGNARQGARQHERRQLVAGEIACHAECLQMRGQQQGVGVTRRLVVPVRTGILRRHQRAGAIDEPEQAERFSDLELVNLLAVSLPFHPAEKQALLEAPTLKDRENTLINLLRLGGGQVDPDASPRTLN